MSNAPLIPTTAKEVCLYALNVINGRWLEAEATIATDSDWAFWYAFNVI